MGIYERITGRPSGWRGGRGMSKAILELEVDQAVKLPTYGEAAVSLIGWLRKSGRIEGRKYETKSEPGRSWRR